MFDLRGRLVGGAPLRRPLLPASVYPVPARGRPGRLRDPPQPPGEEGGPSRSDKHHEAAQDHPILSKSTESALLAY